MSSSTNAGRDHTQEVESITTTSNRGGDDDTESSPTHQPENQIIQRPSPQPQPDQQPEAPVRAITESCDNMVLVARKPRAEWTSGIMAILEERKAATEARREDLERKKVDVARLEGDIRADKMQLQGLYSGLGG